MPLRWKARSEHRKSITPMHRIKARKKKTEILYIFFGIHTTNTVHMAERLAELQETKAA